MENLWYGNVETMSLQHIFKDGLLTKYITFLCVGTTFWLKDLNYFFTIRNKGFKKNTRLRTCLFQFIINLAGAVNLSG